MTRTARKNTTKLGRAIAARRPKPSERSGRAARATPSSREYREYLAAEAADLRDSVLGDRSWDITDRRRKLSPEQAAAKEEAERVNTALRQRREAALKAILDRPLNAKRDLRELGTLWIRAVWCFKNGRPSHRRCIWPEIEAALVRALAAHIGLKSGAEVRDRERSAAIKRKVMLREAAKKRA